MFWNVKFCEAYFPFHLYWTDIGVNVTALSLHSYSYSRWIIPTSNTSHFIPASASLSNHFQLTKSIALSFLPLHPINLLRSDLLSIWQEMSWREQRQSKYNWDMGHLMWLWLARVGYCFYICDFLRTLYDQKIWTDSCSRFIFEESPAVNIWFLSSTYEYSCFHFELKIKVTTKYIWSSCYEMR